MKNIVLTLETIDQLRAKLHMLETEKGSLEEQFKVASSIVSLQRSCEDHIRENLEYLDYANLCM